jgi:DNA-binding IclR family transcriptional regulator
MWAMRVFFFFVSITMVDGDHSLRSWEPTRSKSFGKLLTVLDLVHRGSGEATCASIAAATGINRTTVWRLLADLEAAGFVQADEGGKYRLGRALIVYGLAAIRDQVRNPVTHALLLSLRDRVGETCHLAVPEEDGMVYVDKVESQSSVRVVSSIGKRIELHCTALGKAYLAFAPSEVRKSLIDKMALPARTPRTITDRKSFLKEIELSRSRGWALDNEENEEGIRCIAAPILESTTSSAIAAISITAPLQRMSEARAASLAPLLCETANAIATDWS